MVLDSHLMICFETDAKKGENCIGRRVMQIASCARDAVRTYEDDIAGILHVVILRPTYRRRQFARYIAAGAAATPSATDGRWKMEDEASSSSKWLESRCDVY